MTFWLSGCALPQRGQCELLYDTEARRVIDIYGNDAPRVGMHFDHSDRTPLRAYFDQVERQVVITRGCCDSIFEFAVADLLEQRDLVPQGWARRVRLLQRQVFPRPVSAVELYGVSLPEEIVELAWDSVGRQVRFNIAHELAHAIASHSGLSMGNGPVERSREEELEADAIALDILHRSSDDGLVGAMEFFRNLLYAIPDTSVPGADVAMYPTTVSRIEAWDRVARGSSTRAASAAIGMPLPVMEDNGLRQAILDEQQRVTASELADWQLEARWVRYCQELWMRL